MTTSATLTTRKVQAFANAKGGIAVGSHEQVYEIIDLDEAKRLRRELDNAIAFATFLQPVEGPHMDYAHAPKWLG